MGQSFIFFKISTGLLVVKGFFLVCGIWFDWFRLTWSACAAAHDSTANASLCRAW
jgi:hypothetical protein